MSRTIGPQEECINCGESKAAVRASQRRGGHHVIYCATVDYWGECDAEFDHHRFIWTHTDQEAAEAEEAHWARVAEAIDAEEAHWARVAEAIDAEEALEAADAERADDFKRNEHG